MYSKTILFIFFFCLPVFLFAQNAEAVQFYETYGFENGFYYMLDYPVNIRSRPNLQGEIIGKLGMNARIEILECAGNPQRIENVNSEWYKIKYEDMVGYIFGGYIARETLICDIDNNGIMDYFHYRTSFVVHNMYRMHGITDIFIYINNHRIDTGNIIVDGDDLWGICHFVQLGETVKIELIYSLTSTAGITSYYIFYVDTYGKIAYAGEH